MKHYDNIAKSKSILILAGIMKRHRRHILKTSLWNVKDHSDNLKKNSLAQMILKTQTIE